MSPQQARNLMALALIVMAYLLSRENRAAPVPQAPGLAPAELAARSTPDPQAPGPRDFWVARQNLDPALVSRVSTDMLELRTIPTTLPMPDPDLLVQRLSQIDTKVLVAPVQQGELLMRTRFADARREAAQRQLRDVLSSGSRAIAVDVDALSSSGGFIAQGDLVDVMATYTFAGRQLTRIVLQNVEVLARGYEYRITNRPTGDRVVRGVDGATFTLRVTPPMAVKLAHLVEERGFNRFRLVLKNRDDKVTLHTRGTRLADVLSDLPSGPGAPVEELAEIEVYRGNSLTRDGGIVRATAPVPVPAPTPVEPPVAVTPDSHHAGYFSLEDMADRVTSVKHEPEPQPVMPTPGPPVDREPNG